MEDPIKTTTVTKPVDQNSHILSPDLVRGLIVKLRLSSLLGNFPERPIWAIFMFINGFFTIAVLSSLAMLLKTPFVFPSLGPTAFLFFTTPTLPTASPRNTIYGHAIGIICGYLSLLLFGLTESPPALQVGIDLPRILAAALSLSLTGALMILLKTAHPPAGATTLIISLGLVRKPEHLVIIELAVAIMTLQAIAINRLAGLDYPLWWKKPSQQ